MRKILGVHFLVELSGCPFELLDDEFFIQGALSEATKIANNTLIKLSSHKFEPHGVTAIALLGESHMSVHSWPEEGYAAVDIFTCGETSNPKLAVNYLIDAFKASCYIVKIEDRGFETFAKEKIAHVDVFASEVVA